MIKRAKLFISSLAVLGTLTFPAMAQEKVEAKLQLFRIDAGKETLVLAPRLVALVGQEAHFEVKSEEAKSPAMAFTLLITETSQNGFNFDHHLLLDGQDVSCSLQDLDDLNSQSILVVKTATGKYKLVIATQKYTRAANADQ